MHDEVMALFDDCIERMLQIRGRLAAGRRVHPGERRVTVLAAVEVAEQFVAEATRTVCPAAVPHPATLPALPALPSPASQPAVSAPTAAAPRAPEPVSTVAAAPVAGPRSTLSPAL